MPLRHADLPASIDAATSEWKADHAPILTVRVWLGEKTGLVSSEWAAEVDAMPQSEKPVVEMATAVALAREIVDKQDALLQLLLQLLGGGMHAQES